MNNSKRTPELHAASGIVLAGGRSSRMGHDKARLLLDGEPLVRRLARILTSVMREVVVSGPEDLTAFAPGVRIIPDSEPGLGPLGGLASALAHSSYDLTFVVACDMPFVVPDLVAEMLRRLAERPDVDAVLLPAYLGREHLHVALRRSAVLPLIHEQIQTGHRAVYTLLARAHTLELPPDDVARYDPAGLSAFNVNTPEDWSRATALARNTSP